MLEVGYRAPYDWESMIGFLGSRAMKGVELVSGGRYLRAVSLTTGHGWIAVSPAIGRNALKVEVSSGLLRSIPQVVRRVRRLFDTSSEPEAISEALGSLAVRNPGLRVPGAFDGFEAATRAILGQQISVSAARTIAGRVAERFGTSVETPYPELTHAFPSAATIASASPDEIGLLGIVRKRTAALISIARAVESRDLKLLPGSDVDDTVAKLCQIEGIGQWTAQYIAMRALSYPDAFPHSDLGVMKALGTRNPAEALAAAEKWRPWRAYATLHLWKSLEP